MIVRPGDGVLHLITQPDHAALARRVMSLWPSLIRAERRRDILTALEHHDRGWGPSTRGLPWMPTPDGFSISCTRPWPSARASGRSASKRWSGRRGRRPLVAHHALTVYDRHRDDPDWQAFFPRMTALRDGLLATAGGDVRTLARDYVYVRLGDVLSLTFCTRASAPQTLGPWTMRLDGARLHITPNPFVLDVAFAVEAREIPDVRYTSDEALREVVAAAPSRALEGVVAVDAAH